jgi:uncharacterized protein
MVLYITGVCTRECFYCPLSEEKKNNDVIFANERKVDNSDPIPGIILEEDRMRALGTGITGGDPMVVPERTISIIKALKKAYGKVHHIHLYTSSGFDPSMARTLKEAGLDEIRFHPPLERWPEFSDPEAGEEGTKAFDTAIRASKKAGLRTGIEVPAIPDPDGKRWEEGLRTLVEYAIGQKLDFVNLNELEASHTNADHFKRLGYELVEDSMAVEGSAELARRTIDEMTSRHPDIKTVLHFCSSFYKDSVQLRNRLRRTAENVRRPYEEVTEDGTLIRGVIRTEDPEALAELLGDRYEVPAEMMEIQEGAILIAPWILEVLAPELEEEAYISECYPTADALEVERIPL